MTGKILPLGKLPSALLENLLSAHAGLADDVLVPPTIGEDAGVIAIGGGVLVVATDPITMTGQDVGSHAVVINANDVAVMGVRPRWFLAVFLLPPSTTEEGVTSLFQRMGDRLERMNIALVGGHTEITAAVSEPVVVGQMLGYREDGTFVRTAGAKPGDIILQVGPAPVEGAAVLATEAAGKLSNLPAEVVRSARNAIADPGISVVETALLAADLGATSMHDPTEGGLSAGLYEMALASDLRFTIKPDNVIWYEPGLQICRMVGADPWGTLASGTLLAAFPAPEVSMVQETFSERGHATADIAVAGPGSGVFSEDGTPLPRYEQDELSRVLTSG